MEPASHKYTFKFIAIGDSGVGKSALTRMFVEGTFTSSHNVTLGVEFGSKVIDLGSHGDQIKLQIWDTAGQESFRSITKSYYRSSVGALVVFDVTRRQSFEEVESWFNDVKEMSKMDITILLVGNKIDLVQNREVSFEEADQWAKEHGVDYIETSAKTAQNLDAAFIGTAKKVFDKIQEGKIDPAQLGGVSRSRPGSVVGQGNNATNASGGNSSGARNLVQGGGANVKPEDSKKCAC